MMCERHIDRLPLARPQMGTWPATQACALTGNRTSDLLVHRPALNPLRHTSQGKLALLKIALSNSFLPAHRKATGFCMQILYLAAFLNSLISSNRLSSILLGFSIK